ncbi:hypothetical protein AURDEDRAFT_172946 [Auricularia subglabra TFB-10046 SS5]|uniref:Uncharacterized protein n=1 Tax=Auricularia subglabra (strain TFB-10046 / SS5) TaxID=717982 RepID=J0DBH9_AURST|nr:hypothetical protein AURDEDRAFT_172946 [Auricularia subglabra TFB-10046 SS5]
MAVDDPAQQEIDFGGLDYTHDIVESFERSVDISIQQAQTWFPARAADPVVSSDPSPLHLSAMAPPVSSAPSPSADSVPARTAGPRENSAGVVIHQDGGPNSHDHLCGNPRGANGPNSAFPELTLKVIICACPYARGEGRT